LPTSLSQVTAQKSREQEPCDKFLDGSIVRITLKNFMTYDDITLRPGPKMNFVIGPNGTGKSSLVCALAVGLSASTSVLGRGKKEDAFVKKGRLEGYTEIELHNESGTNHVIKRQFTSEGASTAYFINGKSAIKKDVQELIHRLGIQIDNLCHFLAQDKVADFVQLSKEDRLVNTAKAVGRTDLVELQIELNKLQEVLDKLQQAVNTDEKTIEQLDKQNQALEGDAVRMRERDRKRRDAKVLEVKLRATQALEQNELAKSEKEKLKTVDADLKAKDLEIKSLTLPTVQQQKKVNGLEQKAKDADNQLKSAQREMDKQEDKLARVEDDIEAKEIEKHQLVKDQKKTEKTIEAKENQRQAIVQKLSEIQNINTVDSRQKIKELTAEMSIVTQQVRDKAAASTKKAGQSDKIRNKIKAVEHDIHKLEGRHRQRLDMVNRMGRPGQVAYRAYNWIHQNKDKFNEEVFGPVLMHLDMFDTNDAAMVEASIGFHPLLAFIPQNEHDKDILLKQVYDQQGLQIRIFQPPNRTFPRIQDTQTWGQLQAAGVQGTIDELFGCPEPVMQTLRAQAGVSQKLYGGNKAMDNQQVWERGLVNNLISRDTRKSAIRSKYGSKQLNTSENKLQQSEFLVYCDSVGDKMTQLKQTRENLVAEIEANDAEVRESHQEAAVLRRKLQELKDEILGLGNVAKMKKKYEKQIELFDEQLDDLKSQVDITNATQKLDRDIAKLCKAKVPAAVAKVAALQQMMTHANARIMAEVDVRSARTELQKLKQDLLQAERDRKEIKIRKDQGERRIQSLEADARTAAAVARTTKQDNKRALEEQQGEQIDLDALIEEAMRQVPEPKGIEEIEGYMDKVTQDADLLFVNNPDAIKQYEERKVALVKLRAELEVKRSSLEEQMGSIAEKQQYWKSQLQPIVDKINVVFGRHMEKLKFVGTVELVSHESDFSKWCIDIKVQYRADGEARSLDSQSQSGGEKTMATIIYLTALQEQAKCPFRVVDEINQGVDERNERRIFKVVSDSACEDNNPQMFMMCQKVVTDLDYHENMTILNIFNGPFNCTQRELMA